MNSDIQSLICVAFTLEFHIVSPGFPQGSDRDSASRRRNLLTHTVSVRPRRTALIMCKILPSSSLQRRIGTLRQKSHNSKIN